MIAALLFVSLACADGALTSLKVNSMSEPISIDEPQPFFSWRVEAEGKRGVLATGYELKVSELHANGSTARNIWSSGPVASNQTQFIPYPTDGPKLISNTDYTWQVRASEDSEWAESRFSTGLLQQSDWAKSEWVQKANESAYASQMRKEFTLPAGTVSRARAFVALPGYGHVWVNGHKVDGRAGTRSLSQYDVRSLYHTYDVREFLQTGQNTIAVYVGVGWFGHPAVPPQVVKQSFPYKTNRRIHFHFHFLSF